MKSIKDLEEIRKKNVDLVNQRTDRIATKVVVGMATCGIAAGARPVILSIMEELEKIGTKDVIVAQTGCLGMCDLEPIVEVFVPGQEKVTYVKMTAEKAKRVVKEHVIGGNPVAEYIMHVEK